MSTSKNSWLVLVALLALTGNPADAQQSTGTTWSITPYLWASDTTVDLTFQDANLGGGDLTFSDLLDVLEAAFMVQVEGGKGQWSTFGDLTYLSTSETQQRQLLTVTTESDQLFLDLAVAYWPQGVGDRLNLYGGIRYADFDDRYRFSLNGTELAVRSSPSDFVDALIGIRYRFDLSERWAIQTRGDLSFGDSEGTLLLRATAAYAVGRRRQNVLLFGYQYKQAEYANGDLTADFEYTGPTAGFSFRF